MKLRNWIRVYREENGGDGGDLGGQGGTPTFADSLPEDLRGNESLANFKDVGGLAKSFVEMKSMQGSSIRIPSEDASEDDRKAFNEKLISQMPNLMYKPDFDNAEQAEEFYATLGKPSEATAYGMPEVEGIEMPEERGKFLQEVAHKANLTKAQFDVIMEATLQADVAAGAEAEASAAEEAKALKSEWGMAFEERKNNVARIAEHTGAPDRLIEAIKDDLAGVDTMQWLHKLSGMIQGEGSNFNDDDTGSSPDSGKVAPAEARAKISEINNNKAHPYWNPADPAHKDAMDKMLELQRAAAAG